MTIKMGRPTDNPKTFRTVVRMSETDLKMIEYCAEKSGKTKSEIIREGISVVYKRMKKK